jgi:hypothetical protein
MYVNMTVNFSYKGKHYAGLSMDKGVNIRLKPVDCVAGKHEVVFENGNNTPVVFVENISSVSESKKRVRGCIHKYLLIKPV